MHFDQNTSSEPGQKPRFLTRMPIADVAAALRDNAEAVACELLGEPNKQLSNARELRWGNQGALRVHTAGDRKGSWHDESGGDPAKGDMLKLAIRELGGEDAGYEWARRWCGDLGDGSPLPTGHATRSAASREADAAKRAAAEADEARRQALGLGLWESGQPTEGTQAEAYLKARGLTIPPGAPLRFLPAVATRSGGPRFPALMAKISLADGTFCAVHLTFLDYGGAPRKAATNPAKKVFGVLGHGAIWLTEPRSRMVIGEGIESALSLWMADPTLGVVAATNDNFVRVAIPDAVQEIIVAVDVDNLDKNGRRAGEAAARKAVQEWMQ